MRIILIVLTFCFYHSFGYSQNLVPNPSFEDTVACPYQTGQVNYAVGWQVITESPDYFHSCQPGSLNVPNTGFGFQYAKDGNAMVGSINFSLVGPNAREFFGIPLAQTLIPGQIYYGSFYVSLADNSGVDCAIDKIGMKLTTYPIFGPLISTLLINNDSHIYSSTIINDKLNWVEIKGSFMADSAYQYLLLGNFFEDSNTNTTNCVTNNYYFIDKICLSTDSSDCFVNTSIQESNSIEIQFTVVDGILNISTSENKQLKFEILNEIGQIIKSIKFEHNTSIDVSSWPIGVYFLKNVNTNQVHKLVIPNP